MTYIYAVVLEFTSGATPHVALYTTLDLAQTQVDRINESPELADARQILGIKRAYVAQRAVQDA